MERERLLISLSSRRTKLTGEWALKTSIPPPPVAHSKAQVLVHSFLAQEGQAPLRDGSLPHYWSGHVQAVTGDMNMIDRVAFGWEQSRFQIVQS